MKKLFLNGKLAMMLLASLAFVMFSAGMCGDDNDDDDDNTEIGGGGSSQSEYKDKWAGLVNEDSKSVSVDGNTLTYGNHSYTVKGEIDPNGTEYKTATAWVEFTNIPSGFKEFKAVYEGLLGKTTWGTASMIPMAMEIYARNAETGEKCFNLLCNSDATVKGIIRILKTKIVLSKYSPENDQYIQRYMAAALLKGASNTNAYTPDEPYTVEMTISPNHVVDAPLTGGEVTYLYILAPGGWDTFQRSAEIFQDYDGGLYKVFNCPACYTQCKNIRGTWGGLK
jgi:hypothetical protein